jgi:glutathione synthase/RimK-type ligase-like ATP-grasp enzyme
MAESYDIGLLTCSDYPDLQSDFHFLKSELEAQGLKVRPVVWNQIEVDWSNFKNLLFCSVWDYCSNYPLFHKWLSAREGQCNVINSPEIIRWNLNKSYLQHFEKNSIPVIPTRWIYEQNQLTYLTLDWQDVIVKPAVGAGSSGMKKFESLRQTDKMKTHINFLLEDSIVMVQPYLESADKFGETALIYFNGELSHTTHRPLGGHKGTADERVETATHIEPSDEQIALGKKVLENIPFKPTYIRVDLLKDDSGKDVVLEVEMIEPSLFLKNSKTASTYAKALAGCLVK